MQISKTNKIILALLSVALLAAVVLRFMSDPAEPQSTISDAAQYEDTLRVTFPQPNSVISSPIVVTGEARGSWFFEAGFPIVVVDWDGLIIGEGFATAEGDWMTEEYVPFSATITFDAEGSISDRGALILQRNNPSGLPENDDAFEMPIRFASE